MITTMANYGIRNGPKAHKQEWLDIVCWRQQGFFYTETNPQKKKCQRTTTKITGGPYTAEGYAAQADLFWFSYSLSRSHSYTEHVHTQKGLKPRGEACAPLRRSQWVVPHLPEPKAVLLPSHAHTRAHTHTETCALHSEEVRCMLEGRGRLKPLRMTVRCKCGS